MAAEAQEGAPDRTAAAGSRERSSQRWAYGWVGVVLLVGALAVAALTFVSARLADSNEHHLLELRSKEVAAALTSALPDTETPLGAAAALANTTGGNRAKFVAFASRYVGTGGSKPFLSISAWRVGHFNQGPVAVAGTAPELPSEAGGATAFLGRAATSDQLSVTGLIDAAKPRLGYAYAGSRDSGFVVYAEQQLPASRYTRLPPNSAYSNLNIAVYFGKSTSRSNLLLTTVRHLPLPGDHAEALVPFGTATLAIVISADQPLGGTLPERLPWGIAILGSLLTIGAAILTGRLILRQRDAQRLAEENSLLYAEQRGVALTLQHALLPETLPAVDGVEIAVRYDAGVPGIEIGGDWYDLIALGDDKLLLVVGDVSGRGLPAATAMAAVRFAIRYAAQSEMPEAFLPKLSDMPSVRASSQLATVICAVVDPRTRTVTITSAGHLPLLMVHEGDAKYLHTEIGLPVGVDRAATYVSSTFVLPEGATLLGYTDGLVERRSESLDEGLERLCQIAAQAQGSLAEAIAEIVQRVRGPESVDDVAIAGMRWV